MSSEICPSVIPVKQEPNTFGHQFTIENVQGAPDSPLAKDLETFEMSLYNLFAGKTKKCDFEKQFLKACDPNSKSIFFLTAACAKMITPVKKLKIILTMNLRQVGSSYFQYFQQFQHFMKKAERF